MLKLLRSLRNKSYTLMILAYLATSIACGSIHSRLELIGTYELKLEKQKIILEVFADGSFSETIYFNLGQIEKMAGRWEWGGVFMSFDKLWIPKSFSPEIYVLLDESGKTGFTSPGHYAITPAKRWGKVTLPIFEDEGIEFTKQQHSK
jgi:hypothetical protein